MPVSYTHLDVYKRQDIDLAKDSLFLILDMDNYYSSQERSPLDAGSSEEGCLLYTSRTGQTISEGTLVMLNRGGGETYGFGK